MDIVNKVLKRIVKVFLAYGSWRND